MKPFSLKFENRIEGVYFWFACLLVILSFLISSSLDIVTHDVYYVISHQLILILLALLFFVFYGITWALRKLQKPVNKTISKLHCIGSISWFVCSVVIFWFSTRNESNEYYKDYSVYDEVESQSILNDVNTWFTILIISFFILQLIFVLGVLAAMIKKMYKTQ